MERVTRLVSQRAVVIFSKSTCCMSHTIKTLFYDLGVNPTVHELDEEPRAGKEIEKALIRLGCSPSVPSVFIGGELVGGANEVMTLHLSGSLRVTRLASQRAVVIFSKSTCCMSHTVKTLFYDLGVNPSVHELDQEPRAGKEMEEALIRLGCNPSVPAVFIGGQLVGGVSEVMTLHLSSSLIPLLKQAGAIWL
ncbi:hypothetical protein MKW92_040415 [Papaver armeniacum]|nr:hypothetical protein MKW92_040415 [Papaver armeniacum]